MLGQETKIEWADATWNPLRGCQKVSEGCRNCYAARVAARFSGEGMPYEGLAEMTPSGPRWTGKIKLVPGVLDQPLRWKRPRRIFVNSMSDLFHEDVPDDFIHQVWEMMAGAPQHTFQILTKRPARMRDWVMKHGNVVGTDKPALPNVWLGVSVENQKAADERIPLLLQTPAAVRFLSMEPLLGPVNLNQLSRKAPGDDWTYFDDALTGKVGGSYGPKVDWIITGGESGPGARPMHPDWVRSLRDQCQAAGVAFHFKQHGEWTNPATAWLTASAIERAKHHQFEDGTWVWRVGKKTAGRLLDGREWNEFPDVQA